MQIKSVFECHTEEILDRVGFSREDILGGNHKKFTGRKEPGSNSRSDDIPF